MRLRRGILLHLAVALASLLLRYAFALCSSAALRRAVSAVLIRRAQLCSSSALLWKYLNSHFPSRLWLLLYLLSKKRTGTRKSRTLHHPVLFNHTPEGILQLAAQSIERSRTGIQTLCQNVSLDKASFKTVVLPFLAHEDELDTAVLPLSLYRKVSTDGELRDASSKATKLVFDYKQQVSSNEDLFKLIDAVFRSSERGSLDAESRIVLDKTHHCFIQNGMGIPAGSDQETLIQLQKQISDLEMDFMSNYNSDSSGLWLTREQLHGVPDQLLDDLPKGKGENEGRLWIAMKPHDYYSAVMVHASNEDTRRSVFMCCESRCPENTKLFRTIVILRDRVARILGYPNHAARRLEHTMARTPENVLEFLSKIHSRLEQAGKNELKLLKELKRTHVEKRRETFNGKFFVWDYEYYNQILRKEQYSIDSSEVSEYFEVETTLKRAFSIFEKSFGIVFKALAANERDKLSPTGDGNDLIWHEDVQMFSVWDDENESRAFLGYLYLDIFLRDGKYSGSLTTTLSSGYIKHDGSKNYPSIGLIANFPKPSPTTPSLLTHKGVNSLFYQLGNCLHPLLSRTTYSAVHGSSMPSDFAEVPSQLLEHWTWEPSQLKHLGHHYSYLSPEYHQCWEQWANPDGQRQRHQELADDMINHLVKSKNLNPALIYLRQIFLAIYDIKVHNVQSHDEIVDMDMQATYNSLIKDTFMLDTPQDQGHGLHWGHGYSSFFYMMAGYDAGYYGYLYSKAIAADIYYTAFKENPSSADKGRLCRSAILEKGGSKDPMEMLETFLGRKPQFDAFYKEIGV